MSTVLVLTSSAQGAASVSNQLVEDAVARLRSHDPELGVIRRDLGRSPVPHLNLDFAAAMRGAEPTNEAQAAALALSNELIAELKTADTIIIGAPMYNFGIPSTLKAWFDYVVRAGTDLPLHRGRAGRLAQGQTRHRHREPRRSLQRGPCAGDGLARAASAHSLRLHGLRRHDVHPGREAGIWSRCARARNYCGARTSQDHGGRRCAEGGIIVVWYCARHAGDLSMHRARSLKWSRTCSSTKPSMKKCSTVSSGRACVAPSRRSVATSPV